MIRCRLVLGLSFFVFCAVSENIAAEDDLRHLVSPELLKKAELEILWENKLPIETGERLEQLSILGNRIYGLSSQNYLVSINREKGNVILSKYITDSSFPVVGLGLYGDGLFSIAGNKLVEIDADSGAERSAKRLKFGVTCPAARNGEYFYVGGTDKRLHALRSKDKIQVFEVAANDDSVISSIATDENSVVFATDSGFCASITPDRSSRLWQFKAAEGIAAPIVRDAGSLFAASKDTYVYRLDAKTGNLLWKYQAGAKLEKGPQVTKKVVYQYVSNEGLSAINKETGERLWQMADGVDLLAEANDKAYVITKTGMLAVMDNKKVKQLYSVDFAAVSRYASNVADSKIYIADTRGRIACLKPIEW